MNYKIPSPPPQKPTQTPIVVTTPAITTPTTTSPVTAPVAGTTPVTSTPPTSPPAGSGAPVSSGSGPSPPTVPITSPTPPAGTPIVSSPPRVSHCTMRPLTNLKPQISRKGFDRLVVQNSVVLGPQLAQPIINFNQLYAR